MAGHPYLILDVFTPRRLAGNQLAVFTDAPRIPEELLQPIALEMGFSETAFVLPDPEASARVRIFTPRNELPFAGHPVLGTAVAVAIAEHLDHVELTTGVGTIPVEITARDDATGTGVMRQPVPAVAPYPDAERLLAALGVDRSELPIEVYDNGVPFVYVTLADADAVAAVRPDLAALEGLARDAAMPILGVSCIASRGAAVKTRMFAPADGVPEDPATGSAAGPLACHLARHGRIAFGEEITISQGAELGRPSTLYARCDGTADRIDAVRVGGDAVITASGVLRL